MVIQVAVSLVAFSRSDVLIGYQSVFQTCVGISDSQSGVNDARHLFPCSDFPVLDRLAFRRLTVPYSVLCFCGQDSCGMV